MNIVITGGTRGIGLNHAKYLAAQGHNFALIDISENACDVYGELSSVDKLLDQLSKNNPKNRFYKCDLTNYSDTIKIFNNIVSDYNKIDGCVFNVGGDVVDEGGVEKISVTDDNQVTLLNGILKELKILNFHMSLLTDNTITREDI